MKRTNPAAKALEDRKHHQRVVQDKRRRELEKEAMRAVKIGEIK